MTAHITSRMEKLFLNLLLWVFAVTLDEASREAADGPSRAKPTLPAPPSSIMLRAIEVHRQERVVAQLRELDFILRVALRRTSGAAGNRHRWIS